VPCATLTVAERPAPNVSVVSVRLNPASVYAGDSFTVYATLSNSGSADGYVNLRVALGGSQIGYYPNTGPIRAGQSVELTLGTYTAPSTAGSYSICVEVV